MIEPAAFLFDMDGLLLDTERLYQQAFCDATAALGVADPKDAEFFLTLVGSSSAMTRAAVINYLPSDADTVRFADQWRDAAAARLAQGVPVKPTVRTVLAQLEKQGARMAVVTSTATNHAHDNLEDAGIKGFFEHITAGDMVSANKPDPAPYLETAERLGVDARTCFAFEDSDRGITAAIRAGCKAVQIPDLRPPDVALPDLGQHVASDLATAVRLLRQT